MRNMLKTLRRPLAILSVFAAGYFCPWLKDYGFLVKYLLIIMFTIVSLKVKISSLAPLKAHYKILALNILLPLLWFSVMSAVPGGKLYGEAFLFAAIAPTATAAPVIIAFLGGSVQFAVTSIIITNIGVAAAMIIIIPLLFGDISWGFFASVALNMLIIVGIPVLISCLIRRYVKSSGSWPEKLKNVSFALWCALLFIVTGSASYSLRHTPGLAWTTVFFIGFGSLAVCALNFFIGGFLGGRRYVRECSQSLGQKNTSFTIYLALTYANGIVALGPSFYIMWHNLWNGIQLYMYDRRKIKR